jgi:GAF domain-containing protein
VSDPDVQSIEPVLSARQELEFLAGAGAALTSSLDYEQTLRQVAHLAVPEVADWCGVYVIGDDGAEAEFTSGHADPELDAFITELRRRRREREGASESRRVAESGEPILATDVRGWTADEVDEGERELVSRLAAKSYMVVPLIARGRSIGSLTLLSTRPGRHYNDADLRFAKTLAGRCALAIDNARLHDAAERSLSLLDTVFATAPVGLAFFDPELRFVRINDAFAAVNDLPPHAYLGRTVKEALPAVVDQTEPHLRVVLRTGEPVLCVELESHQLDTTGRRRSWLARRRCLPCT